jgi:membrane protein YqaA with SNARE-associated domain
MDQSTGQTDALSSTLKDALRRKHRRIRREIALQRLWLRLQQWSDHPLYPLLIALLAALDLFVAFIPTDAILISSVLLKRERWLLMAVTVALGSTLGALALSGAARGIGLPLLLEWTPFVKLHASETWSEAERWIAAWGSPGLAFIAVGPLPQQPAVLVCGLSRMPLPAIGLAVFVGRIAKYLFFAWAALRAPRLLQKLGLPGRWS